MSKSPASIQSTGIPVAFPAFSASTLLQVLWEHSHPHLTPQELHWIAEGAPEFNCYYAMQLERVLEGVGCLVSSDGNGTAGTLQSHHDVPDLLFSHATQLGLIGSMSRIGGDAASLLRDLATVRQP